jgi:plasmid stabilization system protein ParE
VNRSFALAPSAESDALDIWEHLADTADEAIADRVVARVYDECQKLAEQPGLGHFREDLLSKRYRFWSAWSYLIVYRWNARPIEVVAIVHGARDLYVFFKRRKLR